MKKSIHICSCLSYSSCFSYLLMLVALKIKVRVMLMTIKFVDKSNLTIEEQFDIISSSLDIILHKNRIKFNFDPILNKRSCELYTHFVQKLGRAYCIYGTHFRYLIHNEKCAPFIAYIYSDIIHRIEKST